MRLAGGGRLAWQGVGLLNRRLLPIGGRNMTAANIPCPKGRVGSKLLLIVEAKVPLPAPFFLIVQTTTTVGKTTVMNSSFHGTKMFSRVSGVYQKH